MQYAVIFDRIFRFAITGSRVRNYDGLGGQLLFAWLHQHHVLHWTDTQLTIDWDERRRRRGRARRRRSNELYWRSIDRPEGRALAGRLRDGHRDGHAAPGVHLGARAAGRAAARRAAEGLTDAVLDDEFPLSMFYEALDKKMATSSSRPPGSRARRRSTESALTAHDGRR